MNLTRDTPLCVYVLITLDAFKTLMKAASMLVQIMSLFLVQTSLNVDGALSNIVTT